MTKAQKEKAFETLYNYEELAGQTTYNNINYFDMSEGAYAMLKILGIGDEYLRYWNKRFHEENDKKGE